MFEESMYSKFKFILNKILKAKQREENPKRPLELVDDENRDATLAEIEKVYGGKNHYDVTQFIPKACVDEYLEFV